MGLLGASVAACGLSNCGLLALGSADFSSRGTGTH